MTMAHSISDDSPTSSGSSSRMCDETIEDTADDGFWSGLARRAKTVLEDSSPDSETKDPRQSQRKLSSESLTLQNRSSRHLSESKWKRQDSVVLHKGLEAIASSLSLLSDTIGNALEEGLNLMETKATNFIYTEPRSKSLKKSLDTQKLLTGSLEHKAKREEKPTLKLLTGSLEPEANREEKPTLKLCTESNGNREERLPRAEAYSQDKSSGVTKDTQLKASRDVAMAMATKAKLLLRELKGVKTDLAFTKSRSMQLEEENKRLRESIDKGARHEEDDLVRLQLEALLAEKARLMQENAAYVRENQFLHEVVQYHQLKLRSIGFLDESLIMMEDEVSLGTSSAVDMDFLPLYPEEKDIIALEESVKIASQPIVIVD